MDEKIDKIIALAGNENRYQYFTLVVIVLLWINCNIIAVIIPYLEREPIVNFVDKRGNYHYNTTLDNEKCLQMENQQNYNIVETYNYSWVIEYNIECDQMNIGFMGSFAFIGNTLGGLIFSSINKCISHKKILIISSIGFCIAVLLCTMVKSFDYFIFLLVFEVFIGMFGNCLCYSSMVIAQEVVSSKKRSLFSSIINVGYSLCGILYSLAFYFLQNWRYVFYLIVSASLFILILISIFIYDSPRAYINAKNYKKTMEILEKIASFNGKLKIFRDSIRQEEYQDLLEEIKGGEHPENKNEEENDEFNIAKKIEEQNDEEKNITEKLIEKNEELKNDEENNIPEKIIEKNDEENKDEEKEALNIKIEEENNIKEKLIEKNEEKNDEEKNIPEKIIEKNEEEKNDEDKNIPEKIEEKNKEKNDEENKDEEKELLKKKREEEKRKELDEKSQIISTSVLNQEKTQDIIDQLYEEHGDKRKYRKMPKIKKIKFSSLFKYPSIRYKFIILNFLWIGTRAVFNGIAIASKTFPGNFYFNIIILYVIESVSYCASGFMIDISFLGRKRSLWIQYFIIIVCFILLAFFRLNDNQSLILNFIARFCISGTEVIYYTYSLELYPTPVRGIAFGINATFGNAGSILAPMLLEYLPRRIFLTSFAIVCVLNSIFLICLPETVGKPMIETISEMEN